MNLLLLVEGEGEGRVVLDGRRAAHLREVLGVEAGRTLRCGLVNGGVGEAEVVSVDEDAVTVDVRLGAHPPRPEHVLIVAVPRPKVLRRVVRDATSLGFGHIVLLRTWRVDKAHMQSHVLQEGAMRDWMIDGLEQARRTWLPRIHVEPLFKPFVEDRLGGWLAERTGLVAHPGGGVAVNDVAWADAVALAVGPERGFTDYEVDLLETHGLARVQLGNHPLRVETALSALAGALDLDQAGAVRSKPV